MAPWNLKSNLSIFRSIFPKITPSSYEYNKKKRKQKRDEKFRSSFNSKTITSRSEKKKSSNQRLSESTLSLLLPKSYQG